MAKKTNTKKVLGIIPARGGSKGLPGKNILKLGDKTLLGWVAKAANNSQLLDKTICSTDDEEIRKEAIRNEIEVPFIRPYELATDNALIVDVLKHIRSFFLSQDERYDYFALIQATSPFTESKDIDDAIELAIEKDADTVITGYKGEQMHPSIMFTKRPDDSIAWYEDNKTKMNNRQDLDEIFIRCGNVYIIKTTLIEKGEIYGDKVHALEIPKIRAISIDGKFDFLVCETIVNNDLLGN